MGDTQDVKAKGQYKQWSEPEHKLLLRLLVDAVNQGFRDANGKFNKLTVERRILPSLNKQLGTNKSYNEYKNRLKNLKGKYNSLKDLLRFSSGFGWDPETKKFTATDEVWNGFLEAHPLKKNLRDDTFEDFEDFRIIFESITASGQNAVGLGDPIDGGPNQIGDTDAINESSRVQMVNDLEGIPYDERSVHEVFSSLENSRLEKLPPRKKARTDACNSNKASDEVDTVEEFGHQIFGMIQRRWEKEIEEKEADDKANNVWDAIKEIPDLTDDMRYEAMTLSFNDGSYCTRK
ncbi:uncharacterized protein At2g29880 [Capsella rubella]|uniref:uncharacterized protein At2g29880 n=1 Tax=Capsella rubella TaxID=81985 RepID=UPI000CD4F9B8|nr:uncharacterized protein At2g29880 [Capsella rubella]